MRDCVFRGYGGAAHTHSSGGGLLGPSDFDGLAALLIKDNVKGSEAARQKALRALMHPLSGNKLVRDTLTCYEREVGSAQPTVAAGLQRSGSGSDSDSDEGEASTLLQVPEFTGAAVSMLPPGDAANGIIHRAAIIGSTVSRNDHHTELHEADAPPSKPTVEAAAFCTLLPKGEGGFAETDSGCSRQHYIHKTLGSISHIFSRAQEASAPSHLTLSSNLRCDPAVHLQFIWFQFQEKVRRGLAPKTPRFVGGHLVTEATNATLDEHKSDIEKQWEYLQRTVSLPFQTQPALSSDFADLVWQHPEFVPYCTMQESYTGGVPKTVVGSKAYWCPCTKGVLVLPDPCNGTQPYAGITPRVMLD